MVASIPAALKAADIGRFALRAGQLENARPAVAYWCNYWIVEQIIAKSLHQQDEDNKAYTMALMDKLEQIKLDYAENDAIVDDMAGHAYIEQFAQETFQRADNAMSADKASRQTADTFQAAATFFEINQVWGPLDAETASKIKFAKFHALRIAKAIKAGEDPNATNPKAFKPDIEAEIADEGPGVQAQLPNRDMPLDQQPSVADELDQSSARESTDPKDTPCNVEHYYQEPPAVPDVSPLGSPSKVSGSPNDGNYFPNISDESVRGTTPAKLGLPNDFAVPSPLGSPGVGGADLSHRPASMSIPDDTIAKKQGSTYHIASVERATAAPSSPNPGVHPVDEVAIMAAQKHAKFAISALNFEDVSTAVKELREAIQALTSPT